MAGGLIMKKNSYEDFSLKLALFDALPVIFFGASMILISLKFKSVLVVIGAVTCTAAGLLKVLWKIIIAGAKKDISPLNKQMRVLMPTGFIMIICGVIISRGQFDFSNFMHKALQMPNIVFFIITIIGMVLMSIFATKLDSTKRKSNWIEQITNAIAQLSLMIGIIITV